MDPSTLQHSRRRREVSKISRNGRDNLQVFPLKAVINGCQEQMQAMLTNNQLYLKSVNQILVLTLGFWSVLEPLQLPGYGNAFILKLSAKEQYIFFAQNQQQMNLFKSQFSYVGVLRGFYKDFKPIQKIGEGKSASVFLARNRDSGEKVAIKAFSKSQMGYDELSYRALENQIRILRTLNHPSIVKFLGLYQTQKSFYLVTEYIEGKTLRTLIETEQLSYERIIEILKQVLEALNYLAIKNIVHRDLKPQNIIIDNVSNKAVILDFGLATSGETRDFVFRHCGTPGFIAPEILDQNSYEVTIKADVFSLGIIFHLMLMKKFPYKNACLENIVELNREAEFELTDCQYSEVPVQAIKLLQKMLAKDHKTRSSVKELFHYLQQRQNRWSTLKPQPSRRESEPPLNPQQSRWTQKKSMARSNSQRPKSRTRTQRLH